MNTNPNYRMGWKARIIIAAYLAAMAVTFTISQVEAAPTAPTVQSADPDAAACQPYAWKKKFGTVFWTKLFPGTGYEVTIDYEFKYNGCTVQIVWRDCEVNWAIGWIIDFADPPCRHWANAANTRLAIQTNYLACGPGCYSGWVKRVLGVNGQTISTEGSFIN